MTDCSLDDYIKTNHITRNDRGRGGGGKWTKGFQRKDNGGFRSSGQFSRGITKSSNYPRRPSFLPNSGSNRDRWQHDLFASGAAGYGGLSQDAPYEDGNRSNGGTNLLISNLDFGVSDGDIKELFGEFGPLRKSALHYDQSGRSIGTAEVTFISSADALVAYHKYNGVPLDGRAMNIQIVGGGGNGMFGGFISPPSYGGFGGRGWSGSSGFSGGGSRGFRSGGSFRGNMRGGLQRRDGRPDMTLEQLDMELEEYQSHTA